MQFADVFVYDSDCTACCMFCYVGELSVAFVICLDVAILLLNVTVLFCVWVSLLLSCPCMVFHSVCVFYLWCYYLFICPVQMHVLYCCMREVFFSSFLVVWDRVNF